MFRSVVSKSISKSRLVGFRPSVEPWTLTQTKKPHMFSYQYIAVQHISCNDPWNEGKDSAPKKTSSEQWHLVAQIDSQNKARAAHQKCGTSPGFVLNK